MRKSLEEKTAISLKKEYDMWVKYASKSTIRAEAEYFQRMADATASRIDWSQLEPKKRTVEQSLEDRYMV